MPVFGILAAFFASPPSAKKQRFPYVSPVSLRRIMIAQRNTREMV
jgi:hypothetical protein